MVKKQEDNNSTAVYDQEGLRLIYEETDDQREFCDGASETSDAYSGGDTDGMSTI